MCCEMYSCCLCICLETGCKVIGVLYTVLSITSSSVYGFASTLPNTSITSKQRTFYTAAACLGGLHTLSGLLLIYGSFRKKPGYLWPSIALSWLTSSLLIIISMMGFILLYTINVDQEDLSFVSSAYFVAACTLLYFSSIINSRRTEIARGTDNYIRPKNLFV